MRRVRSATALGVTIWLVCASAAAQSTPQPSHWEVDIHVGGMTATTPSKGTFALPSLAGLAPAGARPVPSWFFGDGSSQLNLFPSVRAAGPIASLDGLLQTRIVERRSGGSIGARVARRLTPRFAAELTVDYALGELSLTSESTSALEAARASFVTAFNGLFTSPLIASRTVNSTTTLSDRGGRQIITTGALLFNVTPGTRIVPYVAIGAGVISHLDRPPRAVLEGTYQIVLNVPGFPRPAPTLNQVDSLTVRSSVDNGLVGVFGGGLKYAFSNRWGVRLDIRDYVRSNTISTIVDASPATTSPTTFGVLFLSTLTNPPVVFSGLPSFSPSTLSDGSLRDFKTFRGTGIEQQINVTAGLFWRF
jgi:hypothetical protein